MTKKPSTSSFACRGGERHPGLLEGVALRGAALERRPWSVRRAQRVSSRGDRRAGDNGCLKAAEEGNVRPHAPSSVCNPHGRGPKARTRAGGRVLHSVLQPVLANPRYASRRKPRWRGGGSASRLGKPGRPGGTNTGASSTNEAQLVTRDPPERERVAGKKRKEIEVSVPTRTRESSWSGCPHVELSVAEVGRRRLVSNKLGKRAPKRAAGSSERGPSPARRSAGETVGRNAERSRRREVELTGQDGRGSTRVSE